MKIGFSRIHQDPSRSLKNSAKAGCPYALDPLAEASGNLASGNLADQAQVQRMLAREENIVSMLCVPHRTLFERRRRLFWRP